MKPIPMVKLFDLESLSDSRESIMARLPAWSEEEALTRLPRTHKLKPTVDAWLETDRQTYGSDIVEKAALNPLYSSVVLVSWWSGHRVEQWSIGSVVEVSGRPKIKTETDLVSHALFLISHMEGTDLPAREFLDGGLVAGWNIAWDLGYLLKRAWILGIPVPKSVFNPVDRYPIPSRFIDLMKVWQAGDYKAPFTSLDSALRALGLPPKTHDGSEFGRLWAEDREKACAYARAECESLVLLAKRLGVL